MPNPTQSLPDGWRPQESKPTKPHTRLPIEFFSRLRGHSSPIYDPESQCVDMTKITSEQSRHSKPSGLNQRLLGPEKSGSALGDSSGSSSSTSGSIAAETDTSTTPPSTALTSVDSAVILTPPVHTFETQGIFIQPHVEPRLSKIYKDELRNRLRTALSSKCKRYSWELQFSMAGSHPESLAPSILVWCGTRDSKLQTQKYFDQDQWLRERLHVLEWNYHILDQTPLMSAKQAARHQRLLSTLEGSSLTISDDTVTPCGLDLNLPGGKTCKTGGLITVDGVPYLQGPRHGIDDFLRSLDMNMTGPELDPSMSSTQYSRTNVSNLLGKSRASTESSLLFNVRREGGNAESRVAPGSYHVRILFPPVSASNPDLDDCPEDNLDWLLIDLSTLPPQALEKVLRPNQISGTEVRGFTTEDVEDQDFVMISAPGDSRTGVLTNISSTLNIDGLRYEVMLITMDKHLPLGTSGIWVKKGDLVPGYIVAVRQDLPWAYMIPMGDVIADMKKALRTSDIRIPEAAEVEMLRELFISKAMTNNEQEDSCLPGLSSMSSKSTIDLEAENSTTEPNSDFHTTVDSIVLSGGFTSSQYVPDRLGSHVVATCLNEAPFPQSSALKLRQALEWRMERNWEHQKFISRREIDIVITKEVVSELVREDISLRKTVQNWSDDKRETLIKHIKTFTPRLLCMCIYVDLPLACLCELLDCGVDDSDLPLSFEQCPAVTWRTQWDLMIQTQGSFLAVEFLGDSLFQDREVPQDMVLPFLSETPKKLIGEGSFGQVYKVKIHPDYDVFSAKETTPKQYALKVFPRGAHHETAYRNEVSCYQRLSKTLHEHITTLHASWRQGDYYFLLMPAAKSNLGEFLSTKESPDLSNRNFEWLILQLQGLAAALRRLHMGLKSDSRRMLIDSSTDVDVISDRADAEPEPRYTCFHHDLKPSNILVFEDDAGQHTWKISDFGMARTGLSLNTDGLDSESYFTHRGLDINAAYGAPETYQSRQLSRSIDIWSLGCVFTEVVMWFLGGSDSDPKTFALQRFQEIPNAKGRANASFWYIDARGDPRVKPVVVEKWLELSRKCSTHSAPTGLVSLIRRMLTIDPTSRPDALFVCTELDKLVLQVGNDASRPTLDYLSHRLTREGEHWDQLSTANIHASLEETEKKTRSSKRPSLFGQMRSMGQILRQIVVDTPPLNIFEPILLRRQHDNWSEFQGFALEARERNKDESGGIVAWLDERSLEGNARTRGRPLTAYELYLELSKPRFPSRTTIGNAPTDPDEAGQHSPLCSHAQNADRRLVYITNLDRWTIYALVRTASMHQASALRGTLSRYLASETFIQVTSMTKDRGGFELEFNLPYYVWRTGGTEQKDPRQYPDGTALRQSQDISFVHWKKNSSTEFLYEAQVSCVVAGLDDWRWVAYCFSDTYFSMGADEEGEDILQEKEDRFDNEDFHTDPLTGVTDADDPILDPRVYYLKVFLARLTKITREWQLVARSMLGVLREYDEEKRLSESTIRKSNNEAKKNFQMLSRSFNHVTGVMGLSTQLSDRLCQTVDEVEKFLTEDEARFHVFLGLAECWPLLAEIQTELRELQRLRKTLEKVEKHWSKLAQTLELDLSVEATQPGHDKRGLSKVIILLVCPMAMAASIFSMGPNVMPFLPPNFKSMDPNVMPFLPPNFKSFLGLLLFFVSIAAIHSLINWRRNSLLAMAGSMCPNLQLGALQLKLLARHRRATTDEESRPG